MHKLFHLFALGLIIISMPAHAVNPAALIGKWEVSSIVNEAMGWGLREIYMFYPNGTYKNGAFSNVPGSPQVLHSEAGTYTVQGNRLTLQPQGGYPKVYGWQITRDPVVRDLILWLIKPDGVKQQFYYSQ